MKGLYHGDCIEVMRSLPGNSIDTCITDPPYHLTSIVKRFGGENAAPAQYGTDGAFARASKGFMGKTWDGGNIAADPATWAEVYRVLKPGAILLAFGGTRTYHRMVCAIEDAGFEIRDMIEWVYGSGFPKSYDIGKGMDKPRVIVCPTCNGTGFAKNPKPTDWSDYWLDIPCPTCEGKKTFKRAGAQREVTERRPHAPNAGAARFGQAECTEYVYSLPSTPEAQLWDGWGTALKPAHEPIVLAMKPIDGTYANNALTYGVAGLWIDGGRVGTEGARNNGNSHGTVGSNSIGVYGKAIKQDYHKGRFPANLIHDGSDEVVEGFPNDAQRFFYCAKASRSERNAGLEGSEPKWVDESRKEGSVGGNNPRNRGARADTNSHPTVKPIELMRYLVRLTKTPTGGVVLDPFMGSGTTGIACALEGREFIGIEREQEYIEIAEKRIAYWSLQPGLEVE